jgi:formiminotetrahydrofolate cyclodeaminase
MTFLDRSLRDFLASLAARTPTPGGGSIAALNAGLGLGLVAMAARFTSGKNYVAVEAEAQRVAEACDALRAQASELVDADSRAYDEVTKAYSLPKNTEAEKGARTQAIQRALSGAIEVPARTLAVAMGGLELAAGFATKSNRNLASDVLVGASCLFCAVEGARANVRINASGLADAADAKKHLDAADRAFAEAGRLLAKVRDDVEPSFKPAR